MANDNMKHRRLQELGESDFEIVDGQPDIRGWEVKDAQGRDIGEVEELIFDARTRKVRYMVVDLEDNEELDLEDREVLIPIGLGILHRDDDEVILSNISAEQLRSLPEYDEDHLTPDVERTICSVLGRDTTSFSSADEMEPGFYEHEHFDEDSFYRGRSMSADSTDQERYRRRMDNFEDEESHIYRESEEAVPVSQRRDTDIDKLSLDDSDVEDLDDDIRRRNRDGLDRSRDGGVL